MLKITQKMERKHLNVYSNPPKEHTIHSYVKEAYDSPHNRSLACSSTLCKALK